MGNRGSRSDAGGDAKRQRVDDSGSNGRSASKENDGPSVSKEEQRDPEILSSEMLSEMLSANGTLASLPGAEGNSRSRVSTLNSLGKRSNRTNERIQPTVTERYESSRPSISSEAPASNESRVDRETKKFLAAVMRKHLVFTSLEESGYESVFAAMRCVQMTKGQVVFSQGAVGDSCYFIRSGLFSVSIDGAEVKQLGPMETFGELALLYHMTRSATITCVLPGEVWRMSSQKFFSCMESLSSTCLTRALAFFRSDPNFRNLRPEDQRLLASKCSTQNFMDGDVIMRAGEVGAWMFAVMSGKVVPTDERQSELFERSGSLIGIVGLVYGKRQTIGFKAKGSVTCLALSKVSLAGLHDLLTDVLRRCAVKVMLHNMPRGDKHREVLGVLTDEQQHRLIGAAEDGCFEPGEIMCCPGDPAQLLVIVDGEAAICSYLPDVEQDGDLFFLQPGTNVRGKAERILTDGMGYGEQPELLYNKTMTVYIVAVGRCRLHRITHMAAVKALQMPLLEAVRVKEIKKVLTDIFLFKNLREDQVERTVRRLEQQTFAAGDVIVKQDDPARHFFLIQRGTICVKIGDQVVRTLGRWDYFGERGLLLQERRSATCQALEECCCLVLDADVFFEIVGMFRKELERRMHLQDLNVKITDLQCKAVVGRGTFGVVRLVHPKAKENTLYALKCVKKWQVVKHSQEKAIVMEREVNAQCYHPCIVQFIKTFQDKNNVYFLTEFLGGGDLFVAIRQIGTLTKAQVQFFSGSIVLGIEYLHARGIMYRDLKPENVLLDFQGYAKLVDFGCCKKVFRTSTLIGTPEYLAPEVIRGAGYTCVVDWWSLGVMVYEFIVGPVPFGGVYEDNADIFRAILEEPLAFPDMVTDHSALSIMEGLLNKTPQRRLGSGRRAAKEIQEHIYFFGFNWDALAGGFLKPPWKPDQEALMKQWEPPDGDLMDHVGREHFNLSKGMEWAKEF